MFLAIASGIAFCQHLWRNLRAQTFDVEEIDTVTSMLEDVFALLDVRVWPRVPTSVMIAIIAWLIPVAAVFPPGTLRIAFQATDHINQEQVPQLALVNNSNFYAISGTVGSPAYADAAPIVYTASLASATSGRILDIPHKYTNMSYDMQFYAPSIQCSDASDNLTGLAVSHINTTGSGGGIFYLSFAGGGSKAQGLFNSSGFECNDYGTCSRPTPSDLLTKNFENLDHFSTDTARLYVMLGYNLTECRLYNASYNINFDFKSSGQTATIRNLDMQNPVAYNNSAGQYCVAVTEINPDCMQTSTIGAYQAIMEAFGSLYVGALSGHYTQYTRYQTLVETLSIAPNLTAANENEVPFDVPSFQKQMEAQFQNITLSMLSFSGLIKNESRADQIPVTITTYPAVYDYQPLRFYLAYGIAIFCTIICTLIGLYSMNTNGASYSNTFSTFARMTTHMNLSDLVSSADDAGNPCPPEIKRVPVTVGGRYKRELDDIPESLRPTATSRG